MSRSIVYSTAFALAVERAIPDTKNDEELACSPTTSIAGDDWFRYRPPDLAGDPSLRSPTSSRRIGQFQSQQSPEASPTTFACEYTRSSVYVPSIVGAHQQRRMAELSQQATQPATQPYENPRRQGRTLSDVSEDDATDVICLLHPNSQAAFHAVRATMLHGPEHILQNTDLDGIEEEDLLFNPGLQDSRDFALRMSSSVKRPEDGFRFGRNPSLCDVLLTSDHHDKLISNVHFKIFVNSQGSLMIQDLSTNGTIVDDEHLKSKGRREDVFRKPATRALKNGSIICVLGDPGRQEIKLMIRFPNRGDNEDIYDRKLREYLSKRGKVTNFASMRENTYGNHWNGGIMYNFTGILGKGAFATVYRIQTKSEGTIYAAKELDKRRFVKNGVLDIKFDSELKIMKDLKHPNIVDYIDCQTYSHWIYIIMEYIPCGELSKELQERKSIPEPEVQQIAKQVLRALHYLHRRNITHRDIKPDNILFASRDPLVVKLSDFGLSKCVNDQETFLKTFCGTLLYCAPEVYPDYQAYAQSPTAKRRRHGEPAPKTSPYDQSVDMWSFGAVLFHILCGKPPILGRGDDRGAQMLSNIMTKDVDFQPLRDQNISEDAIHFIARLLNRNPLQRPKESECFQHPWLERVTEPFDYPVDPEPDIKTNRQLHAVEELDEDLVDEALMHDLNQLTQGLPSSDLAASLSPQRPIKRPRQSNGSTFMPGEVIYPLLPQESGQLPSEGPAIGNGRLFGEVGPSMLKSSGVFGQPLTATKQEDIVPAIREPMDQISVNDYASMVKSVSRDPLYALNDAMEDGDCHKPPEDPNEPSTSLMGAEAHFGMLNMASPGGTTSDAATPETTNPITPRTREISPSEFVKSRGGEMPPGQLSNQDLQFSRRIDPHVVMDDNAFAANAAAREASRADKLRQKAETFDFQSDATRILSESSPAHPEPGPDGRREEEHAQSCTAAAAPLFSRTIVLPQMPQGSSQPSRRFGKLIPVSGSFSDQTIYLEKRMTSWGRGIDCTVRYPNSKDVRVPQYGIKMTFWAPGIEQHEEQGGDWTQVPGVRTVVSTSTSKHIWVNDVELRKESDNGDAALYGKVYTGDIVTINQGIRTGEYLKYRVEITFGDSARTRPDKEQPFKIQYEYRHHRHAKERGSFRETSAGSSAQLSASSVTAGPLAASS